MAKKMTKAEQREGTVGEAIARIDAGIDTLRELQGELEDLRDNLEERFSTTERYEKIEEALDQLDEMIGSCENATAVEIAFNW